MPSVEAVHVTMSPPSAPMIAAYGRFWEVDKDPDKNPGVETTRVVLIRNTCSIDGDGEVDHKIEAIFEYEDRLSSESDVRYSRPDLAILFADDPDLAAKLDCVASHCKKLRLKDLESRARMAKKVEQFLKSPGEVGDLALHWKKTQEDPNCRPAN